MKHILIILILIISISCNKVDVKSDIGNNENINNIINSKISPVVAFRNCIKNDDLEKAKALVDSLGVNFSDSRGNDFYSQLNEKSLTMIEYMLEQGYILKPIEKNMLFEFSKNDTSVFENIFLKKNPDKSFVITKVINECDLKLLVFILKNYNYNLKNCFYISDEERRISCSCACLAVKCKEKSIEILEEIQSNRFKVGGENYNCLIEHSMNDGLPRFASNTFLNELISRNYIVESSIWSPLEHACVWNNNRVIEFFLSKGFNSNWNNSSLLFYHAWHRPGDGYGEHLTDSVRLNSIELLLKNNGNPYLKLGKNSYGLKSDRSFVEYIENSGDKNIQMVKEFLNNYER